MDPAQILARLYQDDWREHGAVPPMGSPEYSALRERDRERRAAAEVALTRLSAAATATPVDLYHAAWLFQHGDDADDVRRAHELALKSADAGYDPARWLAAASFDRWCMYQGRPQKYGTQIVPDGVGFRVWDFDERISDEERARWNVPSIASQHARAQLLARSEPQPPLDLAPTWLKEAIARWKSA